jgi:hypothetical protein
MEELKQAAYDNAPEQKLHTMGNLTPETYITTCGDARDFFEQGGKEMMLAALFAERKASTTFS